MAKKPVKKAAKPAAKPAKKASKPVSKPAVKPAAKKPAAKVAPAAVVKKAAPRPFKKVKRVDLPKNYKPSLKEEYMSAEQLEYFRRQLLEWKLELSKELVETLEHLKEENWQEPDLTDRATVETDANIELRTRDRYRKLINKINDALNRIDSGDYGYCEETGDEIGLKRLEARPIATLTIEAQERHERDERTHYDEDLEERSA